LSLHVATMDESSAQFSAPIAPTATQQHLSPTPRRPT
jgi:hypothetical protein